MPHGPRPAARGSGPAGVEGPAMLKTAVVLAGALFLLSAPLSAWGGEPTRARRPWKGFAVMGNGRLCAVYSDDPRVAAGSHAGLQHLYFRDYTADYVAATAFEVRQDGRLLEPSAPPGVDRADPYSTRTRTSYPGGAVLEVRCAVHPAGAVLLAGVLHSAPPGMGMVARARLRSEMVTDRRTTLASLESRVDPSRGGGRRHLAVARWSNGVVLVAAAHGAEGSAEARGPADVVLEAASQGMLVLIPGASEDEAMHTLEQLRRPGADLLGESAEAWERWITKGAVPRIHPAEPRREALLRAFRANLYAVRSACLSGHVPRRHHRAVPDARHAPAVPSGCPHVRARPA